MKSVCLAIVAAVLFATAAEAAGCGGMVCNNNPTCQKLRNAGKCSQAAAAGGTMPSSGSGYGRNKARY